jgi:TldD protein
VCRQRGASRHRGRSARPNSTSGASNSLAPPTQSASEVYLIENGRLGAPIKGATLIGNGPDVLTRVSMVGNDLKLDDGIGTCGKEGQSVPVGVGQPTLRIDSLTVGGTGS